MFTIFERPMSHALKPGKRKLPLPMLPNVFFIVGSLAALNAAGLSHNLHATVPTQAPEVYGFAPVNEPRSCPIPVPEISEPWVTDMGRQVCACMSPVNCQSPRKALTKAC